MDVHEEITQDQTTIKPVNVVNAVNSMGNPNTEKKKLHKRQVRAREFLKTRTWRTFSDLTPLNHEEVLLVYDLVFPNGKGFRFHFEYGHSKGYRPLVK